MVATGDAGYMDDATGQLQIDRARMLVFKPCFAPKYVETIKFFPTFRGCALETVRVMRGLLNIDLTASELAGKQHFIHLTRTAAKRKILKST